MDFSQFLQPAIFGLTGKPGAGKSYFATRLIIAEITNGKNRNIVTNVPINKTKLRDFTQKDFYLYPLETYTDNKAFFTNRGHYSLKDINLDGNVDFAQHLREDDEGVLFIIDEAHLYFNARHWKNMPQATISYITTIRHCGDSLVWMCQKFSDIDSQIRGKTQAFHLLRNLEKEKLGWFKRGTGFKCSQFLEEQHIQNHASNPQNASWTENYGFEIKVAECYNTSLFNKEHDKKYRVKGIPLNYVVYAVIILFLGGLVWLWNGGFSSLMQNITPNMAQVQSQETGDMVSANLGTLPPSDPFIDEMPLLLKEIPKSFETQETSTVPHVQVAKDEYDYKLGYWFGKSIKSKLTFISDKVTKQSNTDFSFQAVWNNFASLNNVSLATENGIWQMRTPYFNSFLTYIRESGQGANLKETDLILKENVEFNLVHGFELPYETSVATQGVIRSSRSYKEVGFTLDLLLEVIEGRALLKVEVENTDAMDISSNEPIIQTFKNSNIIDVIEGMTYQIADFTSTTSQVTKGIFKNTDYSTQITNKIFFTYGNL